MRAVSFLNTVPLVWGMLHGEERGAVDLSFSVPAECSDAVAEGAADAGLVPVIEVERQKLDIVRGFGIACHGPVRSILLVSKVPPRQIRTLASDSNSRTTVMLARILLAEIYGVEPECLPMRPELATMLGSSDAALLIGDAALHIEPSALPFETLDLGGVWNSWTGLPMVFAVWAGHTAGLDVDLGPVFESSYRYGAAHLGGIIDAEAASRRLDHALVERYLREHIVFELGPRDWQGVDHFLKLAHELECRNARLRIQIA